MTHHAGSDEGRGTRGHDAHDLAGAMRAALRGVEGGADVYEPALQRMVEAALDWHADTAHAAAPDALRGRVDALADWLGDMPESGNRFDYTNEATTVITIDVEELARRLDVRTGTAERRAWDRGYGQAVRDHKMRTDDQAHCDWPTSPNPYRAALAERPTDGAGT